MMKKTQEQISYNMKQVKNKDSALEIALRKELWNRGVRYRKNVKKVYGHPDLAFITKKVAVFVDSEFWHGFDWENRKSDIKSNHEFWITKIGAFFAMFNRSSGDYGSGIEIANGRGI